MSSDDKSQASQSMPFDVPAEEDLDVLTSIPGEAETSSRSTPGHGLPAAPGRDSGREEVTPTLSVRSRSGRRSCKVDRSPFQIGRGPCHLKLDDPFVSPHHAQLRRKRERYVLEDLGSKNGVFLRIADALALEDFDELVLGEERLVFRRSWDTDRSQAAFADSTPVSGAPLPRDGARIIRCFRGEHVGSVLMLKDVCVLGRDGDIALDGDDVDGVHATIERRGDDFFLRDMSSTFGTFIRIHDPVDLVDGDVFLVGRTRLDISYDS